MQAVQSAMAVRRQRSRWEEHRMGQMRRSSRASLTSPRDSLVSIDGKVYFDEKAKSKTMYGQVTMFHVGIVFIVIGLMLVTTGLVPGYVDKGKRKNDILGTGTVFVFIGGLLTTVSRFISNNEERELNEYIQSRLARSKSGHRIVRDIESCHVTPVRERRLKPHQNGVSSTTLVSETAIDSGTPGNSNHKPANKASRSQQPDGHVPPLKPHVSPAKVTLTSSASDEAVLSRIIEEDEIDCEIDEEISTVGENSTEPLDSPSMSLTSSNFETQALLDRQNSQPRRPSKASSKNSFKSCS